MLLVLYFKNKRIPGRKVLRYELPFSTYNIRTRISPENFKSPNYRMVKQKAELNNQVEIASSQKCQCR